MEGLHIAACFVSFISLLLLIIALASDYWVVGSDRSHTGLWQMCKANICLSYGMQVQAYIHATRAFLFMGMVAGAVSFFGLYALFSHTHVGSISIYIVAMSASCVAGFCSVIAMSTFTGAYYHQDSIFGTWFGWSFGIGWASFPLFLLTAGLALR
ncbi:PREDICTED: protein NKG7 [Gekko japonicus]|uniref:Protein NKG7 n=1 Tax=Gekko japonicus TaxID=146911 RepID=A0ABM1KTK1_GEKJA|nr:PREDICTED: protein NKG7 [Gekko japonicus]